MFDGYADTQPLLSNDNITNRAQNRRVEIVVLKSAGEIATTRSIDALRRQYEEIDGEVKPAGQ
jgi:chemotaxis protein MotB